MKRCPECSRDYYDETLLYCLDDGNALLDGPASRDEPATAILSEPGAVATGLPSGESPTRLQINTTDQTAILHTGARAEPQRNSDHLPEGRSQWGDRRFGRRNVLFLSLILLTIGGIGFAIYKVGWPGKTAMPAPFSAMKIERLTTNGKATQAVISPDGKQVVYVIDDGGKRSLWLRQVATATDVRLTAPTNEVFYWSFTISPDGNFLYYIYGGTIRNRMLYQMPLVGGSPKKLIDDISSPIGFSPDGKQIAFVRIRSEESSMMIANADGTGEREIAKRKGEQSFGT
ncbi:MAG: PD40 domain-containing protein, partial [Blastocatellia bacterium]|nr:PD40 domain-containing protein [Blastocatellia bacterium]